MPFKPNYRMQRADRQRAKEQKLQRKIQRRAEKAAQQEPGAIDVPPTPDGDTEDATDTGASS
jgi:hypothetical protein